MRVMKCNMTQTQRNISPSFIKSVGFKLKKKSCYTPKATGNISETSKFFEEFKVAEVIHSKVR